MILMMVCNKISNNFWYYLLSLAKLSRLFRVLVCFIPKVIIAHNE